jgi:YbbR domain-containing protein
VVENVKTLLIRLFIENWPRKLISLILAMIIWMMVSRSMTVNKVIPNVSVRVSNLPADKTIEGMQINGILSKRISLTLIGHRDALDEISAKDLEVVIDAKDKSQEWIATIDKKNIVSLNPDFDVAKQVSRILPVEMIVRQSKLIRERIPITVTQPIGEVPKGYQYLDIYPYELSVNVKGPEEAVKRLKNRGLKLTFNLNDISQENLDTLQSSNRADKTDEISFFVPDSWKKISSLRLRLRSMIPWPKRSGLTFPVKISCLLVFRSRSPSFSPRTIAIL